MIDIYESAVDDRSGYGAVFERDDDTAFFYLLELAKDGDTQIIEALNVKRLTEDPATTIYCVRWNASGQVAGLFANGNLVAVFDLTNPSDRGRWSDDSDKTHFAIHQSSSSS